MMIVSDTSPLRYLIAVGRADVVEQIFGHVLIPRAVERELTHPSTPEAVRRWMAQRPTWLEVRAAQSPDPELAERLDQGEAEAIGWRSISTPISSDRRVPGPQRRRRTWPGRSRDVGYPHRVVSPTADRKSSGDSHPASR